MLIVITGTGACAGYVLWSRRSTFFLQWEMATTVHVIGILTCMLLINPISTMDEPLCRLTGLCNADNLVGHLSYLAGICALTHTMVNRIELIDRVAMLRRRLWIPAAVSFPALVALFVMSDLHHPVDDFIAEATHQNIWCDLYLLVMCAVTEWFIGHLTWALLIIRTWAASATVANLYLIAAALNAASVAAIVARVIWSTPPWPAWLFTCASALMYLVAAWWSWQRKLRALQARSNGFRVSLR